MKNRKKLRSILTNQYLIKQYIKNNKTYVQIAKEIGCSYETIRRYLNKYNIKKHIINHKSCRIVGLALGCNKTIVMRGLKQWKIKRRGTFQVGKLAQIWNENTFYNWHL